MSQSSEIKLSESFIDWFSYKIGKKVNGVINRGAKGAVYDLGNNALKISYKPFHDLNPIIDKNIEGVIKTYFHGKIKVPSRFIEKNSSYQSDTIDIGMERSIYFPIQDSFLYYMIMEKLDTSVKYDLKDFEEVVGDYLILSTDKTNVRPLSYIYNNCEDFDFLKELYSYVLHEQGREIADLIAELAIVFKSVKKHYNWVDIHTNQFGRNSKGDLVAFDLDNPVSKVSSFDKNLISEITEGGWDAYHGSTHRIDKFSDEFVGGDNAHDQEGAGIYFTTNIKNARIYGDYIYSVHISGRFLDKENPPDSVDPEELVRLIKMRSNWENEAYNYDENPEIGAYKAAEGAIRYNDSEADVFQQIEADFYRYDPVSYVRDMTKLGYDGIVVNAPSDFVGDKHIIVFNTKCIEYRGLIENKAINKIKQKIFESLKGTKLYHASDSCVETFDLDKVKGGVRAIYGYGIYFTSIIHKAKDYGDHVTVIDGTNLNFIDVKHNEVTEALIQQLDSDRYSFFVKQLNGLIGTPIDEARKIVLGSLSKDYSQEWSSLFLDSGYDGFDYGGYEYVVFNTEKINVIDCIK